MSLFTSLRNFLLGRQPGRRTTLALPAPNVRFDDFPPFNLHVAELMRFDPQVRVALGARNGLLMSAEVEVTGPRTDVNDWVRGQWDRLWCACAHQLVRAKLYGFQPFEVFLRGAGFQPPNRGVGFQPANPSNCGDRGRLEAYPTWEISETRRTFARDCRGSMRKFVTVGIISSVCVASGTPSRPRLMSYKSLA